MVILPVERAAFSDFLQYFAPALDKHVSYIVCVNEARVLSLAGAADNVSTIMHRVVIKIDKEYPFPSFFLRQL